MAIIRKHVPFRSFLNYNRYISIKKGDNYPKINNSMTKFVMLYINFSGHKHCVQTDSLPSEVVAGFKSDGCRVKPRCRPSVLFYEK